MESIRGVDMALLETLVAVMETGSFRAAADERAIAASTVQKHMRGLERQLDLVLFERVGRNIEPTDAAHRLASAAEPLLREARNLEARIQGIRSTGRQSVRIACAPIHLAHFLGATLRSLQESEPQLHVDVTIIRPDEMSGSEAFDRLLDDNETDLVATIHELPNRRSLSMWRTQLIVVVHDEHRLRNRKYVTVDDLVDDLVLAPTPRIWSRRQLDRLLTESDVQLDVVTENLSDVAVGTAIAGYCVAVLADDSLPGLSSMGFPRLSERRRPIMGEIKLHWRQDVLTPPMAAFITAVRERAAP